MDSINSFIHLLDKIETQDRRLGFQYIAIYRTR